MLQIISKIFPIITLFTIGILIRKKNYLTITGMTDLKKLVVNISLPAVLFKAFFTMKFDLKFLKLSLIIICLLVFMYSLGVLIYKLKFTSSEMSPFFSSGFAFGLIGIPLFSIMYGEENLGLFSIIGLGHEFFIWFIYYSLVNMKLYKHKFSISYCKGFFKSPLIISIGLGLFFNQLGFNKLIETNYFINGIFSAINYIGSLATPLILISIGYSSKISLKNSKETLRLILSRFTCIIISGIIFKIFVIDNFFEPTWLLNVSYTTLFILPPVYSLTVFLGVAGNDKEEELISNATILYTLLSIVLFILTAFYFKI
ncbi:MAG: hypothetical protein Q7K47_03840 [Fusobacterium sp. JB019]|nr:hypothetical protein [Fusobacterium sp. JB019]